MAVFKTFRLVLTEVCCVESNSIIDYGKYASYIEQEVMAVEQLWRVGKSVT